MIPILRRDVTDDEGDPIADVSLESTRAAIQPVDDNGTICPSHYIFEGYAQNARNMAQKFGKDVSSTEFKPRN